MTHKHSALRTRSSPDCVFTRLCVRNTPSSRRLPLASPLPSTLSAALSRALFESFAGTMELSDFPRPFISTVCPSCFVPRSAKPFRRRTRDLPVPKHDASLRARGLRSRGALTSLATNSSFNVAFHRSWSVSALPRRSFRDPIPGPQVPLSTLRLGLTVSSHDSGTSGSLLLSRRGLSPLSVMPVFPAHHD